MANGLSSRIGTATSMAELLQTRQSLTLRQMHTETSEWRSIIIVKNILYKVQYRHCIVKLDLSVRGLKCIG